jgi:RimJ/RimL family protein N-acetyltransferase
MPFQRLANANIVIRPFESADADEFVRAAHESIETVGKWMNWCSRSFSRDSALAWFACCDQDRAAGRAFDMGIFCATTGQLLGGAGINRCRPIIATAISAIGYANPAKAAASPDRRSPCCVNLALNGWGYFGWRS